MADWAHALTQGLAAGMGSASNMMQSQMDAQAKADADQRAADRQLDTASRLAAAQESMRMRAAERFSAKVKAKSGEAVPLEAPTVDQTGITSASAAATDPMSVSLRPENIAEAERVLKARANSAALSEEEREEARVALEQLERQKKSQGDLNAKAVEGKTRARSTDEAVQAAQEDNLLNDPGAFVAGTGMLAAAGKSRAEQDKLASREKIEAEKLAQREREAQLKFDAVMKRIEAAERKAEEGGKGGNTTALRQNVELLKELGYSAQQIEEFIFDKKGVAVEDIAAKLYAANPHTMSIEDATAAAMKIKTSVAAIGGKDAPAGAAPASGKPRMKWNPTTGKFE